MNNSFLNVIILLGALQGFIVFTLLLTSKSKIKNANRYLASLIFFISLASLGVFLMQIGLKYQSSFWLTVSQIVPFFLVMPIGPLIYFYTRNLAKANTQLSKWHFAPISIDLVPHALILPTLLLAPGNVKAVDAFNDAYEVYADIPRWLSVTVYLLLSLTFVKGEIQATKSQDRKLIWLKQFIIVFLCFQAIWLVHLVPYIIPSTRNALLDLVGWYPIYIPLATLIYWLGIKGYTISLREQERQPSSSAMQMTPERRSMIISDLEKAMHHDRLFLDPTLTLAKVSEKIKVPQKQISAVLNQLESKSFNEFVNIYRIEEFKKLVQSQSMEHLTLFGLALECGFNSQATFQRAFKSREGISPSEFCGKVSRVARISA